MSVGNVVSGYNWLDGVGPKDKRPTVLERAWNSIETNQFGTNEFIEWCKLVGTEPLLGFNLGTGTPEMAVAYVEYCNEDKGTRWSDSRRSHGYEQPQRALLVSRQRDGRSVANGACLAQIINVIAPLVTNDTSILRQSIFYPYAWALQYVHGRVLDLSAESETLARS